MQSLKEKKTKNDHYRYCNIVVEAFHCGVTYIMKYTSAFAILSMI